MTVLKANSGMRAAPPTRGRLRRRTPGANRTLLKLGVLTLLVMMVLGPYMSFGVAPFTGDGNPARQGFYILALVLVVAGAKPWYDPRRILVVPAYVVIVMAWCVISMSWSISPAIGIRRLSLTLIVLWAVFIGVQNLGARPVLVLLRNVLIGTLAANWFAVIFFPHIAIHQIDLAGDSGIVGSWCGIMLHKNFAGAVCAFTVLIFTFGGNWGRTSPWLRCAVIVAACAFLWGTQSKTSGGLGLVALIAGVIYMRYNPRYRAFVVPIFTIVGVALVLYFQVNWTQIISPLYDPRAFTGRTQIWPALLAYSADHPFGAGYGSFWNIGVGTSPIFQYSRGWVADLGNGHNGYLDLAVAIGIPGLLLTIFCLFVWPIARLLGSMTAPRAEGALALSLIIFCAGHNFTESTLLERDATGQVMLMFALALGAVAMARRALAPQTATDRSR